MPAYVYPLIALSLTLLVTAWREQACRNTRDAGLLAVFGSLTGGGAGLVAVL